MTDHVSFFHIVSVSRLAARVKRIAGREKRKQFDSQTEHWLQKLEKGMSSGSVKDIARAFKHLLGLSKTKEGYLYEMLKNEMILLNEQENLEAHESSISKGLDSFLLYLQNENPSLHVEYMNKVDARFRKLVESIKLLTDKLKPMILYLKDSKSGTFNSVEFLEDYKSERNEMKIVKQEAGFEKRFVKQEFQGINKVYKRLEKIDQYALADEMKKAELELISLFKEEEELLFAMESEAREIYEIIHKLTFIYALLVDFVQNGLAKKLDSIRKISGADYNEDDMEKQVSEFNNFVNKHVREIGSIMIYENVKSRKIV